MKRALHYLRFGWTVVFGVLAMLLIGLWLFSYVEMRQIILRLSAGDYAALTTGRGVLIYGQTNDPMLPKVFPNKWTQRDFHMRDWDAVLQGSVAFFPATIPNPHSSKLLSMPRVSRNPFLARPPGTSYFELVLPYWLLIWPLAILAVAPWLRMVRC